MSGTQKVFTEMQLQKLKVPELKALCRQRSLAVSGNKAALIARLLPVSASAASPAPEAAATSSSLTIPDQPPSSPSTLPVPPAIPVSLHAAAASESRHAEKQIAASTTGAASVVLPSKRPRAVTLPVSVRPAKSIKILAKIVPATVPADLPLKKFQVLRPVMRLVPESLPSASTISISCPLTSARLPLTLQDLTNQYVWLLPLLGQTEFRSFLPNSITPDCLRAVAAYLLTRVYCLLGQHETDSLSAASLPAISKMEDTVHMVSGVYQCSFGDDSNHTFVGATGEIISSDDNIRPDWSAFLAKSENNQDGFSIISLVRNQDDESFESGISKAFRKRVSEMKDRGVASELLAVAESYVLAHVAPNAISGAWHSVHHQCADFQGMSKDGGAWSKAKQTIGFFLPEAHLVESVSLVGLHVSLAVVQTTHRSHFVFRASGQIVGEGDEGVFPLFQELLGCDAWGHGRKV